MTDDDTAARVGLKIAMVATKHMDRDGSGFSDPAEAYAALYNAAIAAYEAEQWQPIETAPKDGTSVDLFRPGAPPWMVVDVGCFDNQRHSSKPRPYWRSRIMGNRVQDMRDYPPTAWRHRPAPPAGGE